LDRAAAAWERILNHPTFNTDSDLFRLVLYGSGEVFLHRYWAKGHPSDLNQAIHCLEKAVAQASSDSSEQADILNNLSTGLRERYNRTGNLDDLTRAIDNWEQAVKQTSSSSPDLPMYLNNLGIGLRDRYIQKGDLEDLTRAIDNWEQAVEETPSDSPKKAGMLNGLGIGLRDRYARTGNLDDLTRAIETHEQAVEQTASGSPDLPMYLNSLGNGLRDRYTRTGELKDLARAIEAYEQAVEKTLDGSPDLPGFISNLGNGLRSRYAQTGDTEDLTRAIEMYEQAVEQAPSGSPDLPMYLNSLGNGLRDRYTRTGELGDLARAIDNWEQAVEQTANSSPDLSMYLNSLGNGLRGRYAQTGELEDLARAIEAYEQALEQIPNGSPKQAAILNNLGNGLRERYTRTGESEDLTRAIEMYKQAVEQASSGSLDRPKYLNNLGVSLKARYAQAGALADLTRAIEVYEQAVEQAPSGSPEQTATLNNLGNGLRDRYARTGELEDLAGAIEAYEQAVEQAPNSSPKQVTLLTNLGNGLKARYTRTGDLEDLIRAIEAYEQAVEQAPSGSPDLPGYLNNLGNGLRSRYARSRDLEDLARAIEVHKQAVEQTPSGSSDLPMYLNNLGVSLKARYARMEEPGDLARAIEAYEQAVEQAPSGSFNRLMYLNNLGNGFRDRYTRTGDLEDLARAIEAYEQAVDQTSSGSPRQAAILNNLGNGLKGRYARSGELEDLVRAIEAYEQACQTGQNLAIEVALRAARSWGDWASEREEWAEAGRAYGYGMTAIERLYRVQLTRRAKETWLREARGLPARSAYALVRAGDLTNAVLALERGRARLLSEILERDRADLSALKQAHPDHYAAYRRAADRISALSDQELHPDDLPSDFDLAAEMRVAHAELDAAVEAIRDLPGYADFLTAPDWEDIAGAATTEHSLVYLAATPAGGLALVVPPSQSSSESDVHPIWFEDLSEEALREQLGGYLGAYNDWRRNPRDGAARAAWLEAIKETTRWLWDAAMGPVVEALTDFGNNRATLIPAGLLGLLPLHAAWTEDPAQPTGRRYALDGINFAYTPNARALNVARERAVGRDAEGLLAVDEPQPVSASPLPSSSWETAAACDHFPAETTHLLGGEAATKEAVLEALPSYPVLHLSCHGFANPAEPLESGLLMAHDQRLTLRDVQALRLERSRLAVLSACETRFPGIDVIDEVIALPTGLVQAGVPGVVGSLWSVLDLSTAMLMVRFYDLWRGDGLPPAEALRQAQIWLRDTTNAQKADYFGTELPELSAARMPVPLADALFKEAALKNPEERAFAQPFHWAAFAFTGV
jgi:CHAT domain-containing protein/predicted negative regulator of RcsB-dependent stress response